MRQTVSLGKNYLTIAVRNMLRHPGYSLINVLGASVWNVMVLISREFVILDGVANLIAWPIIYVAMDGWLQHFAYRIELGVGPFVLGSGLAFVIVLMTVSTQAWKATRANPAVALRYE